LHPVTARVWLGVLGVCLGSIAADGARVTNTAAVLSVACGGVLIALRRKRMLGLLGVVAVAAGTGMARTIAVRPAPHMTAIASNVPRCATQGTIVEHNGGFGTLVRVAADCDTGGRTSGAIIIDGRVGDPGSAFDATGLLVPLGSDSFDRARSRLGASAAFIPSGVSISTPRSPPSVVAARLRANLQRATSGLGPRERSLVLGLAIGDDSQMDATTEDSMRASGLSHLVAVSGSNVAIVVGAAAVAASSLGLRTRVAVCALVLGIYVLVVGPEPSVLRAALMGCALLVAIATGRMNEPMHALGVALLVLLLLRPASLWSVGLHLSAAATAGIVLWTQPIARRMRRWPRPLALALAATIAAQIAVAPILVGVFGELPLLATVANLAVLPAIAPATICALLAAVIGGAFPAPAAALAAFAGAGASWVLRVAHHVSSVSWSTVAPAKSWAWVLAAAAVIFAIAAIRRPDKVAR
jgi:competence protein ComEC